VIFAVYRQHAAKRQTAGIKFPHRPKIRVFAPQGRIVAPIHFKQAYGSAWLCKISPQSHMGGNAAPKLLQISTFW